MKTSICVFLIGLLSSCIIQFNGDEYKFLSDEEKKRINSGSYYLDSLKPLELTELPADDLIRFSGDNEYTLIYFFKPYCAPCIESLKRLIDAAKSFDGNFKLIVISDSYQIDKLKNLYTRFAFRSPIFIMPNNPYGDKLRPKTEKYFFELNKHIKNGPVNSDLVLINRQGELLFQDYKFDRPDTLKHFIK